MDTELADLADKKHFLTGAVILTLIIAVMGISAYNSSMTSMSEPQEGYQSDVSTEFVPRGDSAFDQSERKKATSYRIDLKVEEIKSSESEIGQLIRENEGYIISSYINSKVTNSGSITARIPSNNSENFISKIGGIGTVESKRVTVNDITDQYDQVGTELRNRKQELEQLENLMNKTDTVSELIQIQERMSTVRSRIEYLEQRKARLDSRIKFDEVTINLSQPTMFNTRFELRNSLSEAYEGVFKSLNALIIGVGYLLPLLIIAGLGFTSLKAFRALRKRF